MANIKMKWVSTKPQAVISRSILKFENTRPFLLLFLGSLIYGELLEAYIDLAVKFEAYTYIEPDIKGILKEPTIKGVIK